MPKYQEYSGKYIRLNLTNGSISVEELPDEIIEGYLGGTVKEGKRYWGDCGWFSERAELLSRTKTGY